MHYDFIEVPTGGEAVTANPDHTLNVPDRPIIPYIEGDGIGIDVTPVMLDVVNAAVGKAYGGARAIEWMQVYAGQRATEVYGGEVYMPDETLHALEKYVVSIKGPLATPIGEVITFQGIGRASCKPKPAPIGNPPPFVARVELTIVVLRPG